MPVVSCAIMPNSPLLLPKLSPPVQKQVTKTSEAIARLGHELYALQPTIIVIISTSNDNLSVSCLLQAPKINYSFAEWGDVVTKGEAIIATGFTHSFKERTETSYPIILKSVSKLPTHFAVPAVLLAKYFPQLPLVFLQLPLQATIDDLSRLSTIFAEQCSTSSERIIILATGTLAQQKDKFTSEAPVFDKYFQSALSPLNLSSLVNMDANLRHRVKESIWSPTTLMSMVISERITNTVILSYESPSRVGYLVALLNLK